MKAAELLLAATFLAFSLAANIPPFIGITIYTITSRHNPKFDRNYNKINLLIDLAIALLLCANLVLGVYLVFNIMSNYWLILLMSFFALASNSVSLLRIRSFQVIRQTIKVCLLISLLLIILGVIVFSIVMK
jgi:hypothetical protein